MQNMIDKVQKNKTILHNIIQHHQKPSNFKHESHTLPEPVSLHPHTHPCQQQGPSPQTSAVLNQLGTRRYRTVSMPHHL